MNFLDRAIAHLDYKLRDPKNINFYAPHKWFIRKTIEELEADRERLKKEAELGKDNSLQNLPKEKK